MGTFKFVLKNRHKISLYTYIEIWAGGDTVLNSKYKKVSDFFPRELREVWDKCDFDLKNIQEIRIRVNQPVRVLLGKEVKLSFIYGEKELEEVFRYLCNDSVYAYEDERTQGYIMLSGGHRVGITGELTMIEGGRYIAKYIRYINIRVAHEIKKISESLMEYLYDKELKQPLNTLIASPPGIGKTTLLRDIIRSFSNGSFMGEGCNVGVIDERGEIAGAYRGSACLDCGERTDIITGGDKNRGISVLVRAFAPKVIAIDEIGSSSDAEAIFYAGLSGCKILATIHARNIKDVENKTELSKLIQQRIFDRIIVLSKETADERFAQIFDAEGNELCGKKQLQACL